MKEIKLTNSQFLAIVNIIRTQSIPLSEAKLYLSVLDAIDSANQESDGSFIISLEDNDLNILVSIVENGNVLVKDIPFVVGLLNVLAPPVVNEPELVID